MLNDLYFDPKKLGECLRIARAKLGTSLRDVSGEEGVSPSQILRLESGEYDCTVTTLAKVCGALGMRPAMLMEYCAKVSPGPYLAAVKEDKDVEKFPQYRGTSEHAASFENYIWASCMVMAYLLRSASPEKTLSGIAFPVKDYQSVFEMQLPRLKKGLAIQDRYEQLMLMQSRPIAACAHWELLHSRSIRKFAEWWIKHSGEDFVPWIPQRQFSPQEFDMLL